MSDDATQYFVQGDTEGEYVPADLPDPPGFRESLTEDLQGDESLQQYESANDLATAHLELLSQQPDIPQTPDDYQFEIPENFPLDDNRLGNFKKIAHESRLAQTQFDAMAKAYVDDFVQAQKEYEDSIAESRKNAEDTLKQKWGDKYDENLDAAQRVLDNLGKRIGNGELTDEVRQHLEDTQFGNDPMVIQLLFEISKFISEGRMESGDIREQDIVKRDEAGRPMLKFKPMT
jgi:hypothetical protein